MKRQQINQWGLVALAVALIAFVLLGARTIVTHNNKLQFKNIELQDTSAKLKLLQQKYDEQLKSKDIDQRKLQELEQQKQELEKQVSAKKEAQRIAAEAQNKAAQDALAAVTATHTVYAAPAASTSPTTGNCGDNMYKQYIYQHESGCRTTAVNSIGCRGLGQACPGDKMPCGDDFACQDAYFTNYAVSRYGSWQGAYNFWLQHSWW